MARAIYLDIEKIRTEVTMAHLLNHYSVQLKQLAPNHLAGSCPIHGGDNKNAFHVDLQKNLFNCFTHCGGGSIFDFVMKKEEISFYKAALKIWNTFYPPPPPRQKENQQLNLRLNLKPYHPYLTKRNVSPQLARYFQMGFCQYGIMKNRIAIPIYDICNRIVAYCGRTINQNSSPKYLFPKNFNKSHHIFNIQHITPHSKKPVFIVEGFFDCIHISKLGFDAVALMGSSLSIPQLTLLEDINRFYILMLDGDDAGRKATIKASEKMAQFKLLFKTVHLIEVMEPESFDYDNLEITSRI